MFKKIGLKTIATIGVISTAAFTSEDPQQKFDEAWNNPAYTQIKLEDVDINAVLTTYYTTDKPADFTREMLWDVERKKAWDPKKYIPHAVREGKSWGRKSLENGDETFTRSSQQRQWMTGEHKDVFEEVHLLNKEQKAIFFGVSSVIDDTGILIQAQNEQPLFHVEHGVDGTEDNPLNTWRIVHLTQEKDGMLIKKFENFRDPTLLPKYIEVYIEKDLNTELKRKEFS